MVTITPFVKNKKKKPLEPTTAEQVTKPEPTPTPTPTPTPEKSIEENEQKTPKAFDINPAADQVVRDRGGQITGVITKEGQRLFGFEDPEAREFIEMRRRMEATPEGAVEERDFAKQQQIEQQKQELLATQIPERRELSPELTLFEKIPFFGSSHAGGKALGRFFKNKLGIEKYSETVAPEELRTAALTAIELQEIEKGLSANEAFGAFVEGSGASGILGKIGITVETPTSNAREVVKELKKQKRRITNIETNVKTGYMDVTTAQDQIDDIELSVQKLESRLRLLINDSPTLKVNNADEVNGMETEILLTREKLLQAKANVLTGQSKDPTEIDILLKMQELEGDTEE